ncbi:CRISPR-associated endonuclease Cas2 [Thermosyntropha sp.]|uniref:CRISPR-associated endonuclease Cas2 n=1 Tax=Thermosyntropha sp. TaxID=2740820 RepID=UPI0025EE2258|nr:CRISPR-associated endonuclease Cas2 [Thermosyntropha sp.]
METFNWDENSSITQKNSEFLVLIIYDISEDKKRNRLAKMLSNFGVRVQKSAFEAWLNQKQYDKLIMRLDKIEYDENDYLRVYKLTGFSEVKTWGNLGPTANDDFLIF